MSKFRTHTVSCKGPNGTTPHKFQVSAATSLNVGRKPDVREAILRREFHRYPCPECGQRVVFETSFLYTDLPRNTVINVRTAGAEACWSEEHANVAGLHEQLQDSRLPHKLTCSLSELRTVVGLEGLREALIAYDAKLDASLVEFAKFLALGLLGSARYLVTVNYADDDTLMVLARQHADAPIKRLTLRRSCVEQLAKNSDAQQAIDQLFATPNEPNTILKFYNSERMPEIMANAVPLSPDLAVGGRGGLLEHLSSRLSPADADARDSLIRQFNLTFEDDWFSNPDFREHLPTLISTLEALPDSTVEDNVLLDVINVNERDTFSFFDPTFIDQGFGTIGIGLNAIKSPEEFAQHVRHEVGHSVDLDLQRQGVSVADWLAQRFGFRAYDANDPQELNEWLRLTGTELARDDMDLIGAAVRLCLGPKRLINDPLPTRESWVDDTLVWWHIQLESLTIRSPDASASELAGRQRESAALAHHINLLEQPETSTIIRQLVDMALPGGEALNNEEVPQQLESWGQSTFGARAACLHSYPSLENPKWWEAFERWHRRGNQCFAINLHYNTLMVLDHTVVGKLVSAESDGDESGTSLDNYALMAPAEFFAELFSAFYNPDKVFQQRLFEDDEFRDVHDWLRSNIEEVA